MDLPVDVLKVIILFSLLVMTFVCGITPVLLLRFSSRTRDDCANPVTRTPRFSYKKHLSFLSCFAAGVFLATCLLDLLPTIRKNLTHLLFSLKVYTGFPVAEFVMIIGLFLILIVEQIVLSAKERRVHGTDTDTTSNVAQPLLSQAQLRCQNELSESYHSEDTLGGICDEPHNDWPGQEMTQENIQIHDAHTIAVHGTTSDAVNSKSTQQTSHSSLSEHQLQTHSSLRAMLLVSALSVHSVFEGLTIGLLAHTADLLGVFAAIAVHKSILSFSLGMNLIQSKISVKAAVRSILLFCLASPVGIVLGIGITDLWSSLSSGLVHGLLQGIASGTFLYIIFFEVLPKEFNSEGERLLKVLFLILGYATVTAILFLNDDIKHPFCVIKGN